MHPAGSGTRGPAPLIVGERHFCHKSQCQRGWRDPIPSAESILSKVWAGAQGGCMCRHCRHHIHSDKKQTSPGALLTRPDIAGKSSNRTHKAITNSCCKQSRATLCALPASLTGSPVGSHTRPSTLLQLVPHPGSSNRQQQMPGDKQSRGKSLPWCC